MDGTRVAIVGGGIAGLSVAAFLGRAGIPSTIYERAEVPREAGAGIQLGPNATRLLRGLGLAGYLAGTAVRPAGVEVRHWRTGQVVQHIELGDACEAEFGAPYQTLHRAALHDGLRAVATASGATVRAGHRCVGMVERPDEVELRFSDGTRFPADLVIGADGMRSVVRRALADDRTSFCGLVAYRALVPSSRLPAACMPPAVRVWLGSDRHVVHYPISGATLNVVAVRPGEESPVARVQGTLLDGYPGWHPALRGVLRAIETSTRWPLRERAPLTRWCTRRVALVGDAAHPLLPFGAQGANQAVEDAAALVTCLLAADGQSIPEAMARYERIRVPRLARIAALVRDTTVAHHLGVEVPTPPVDCPPDGRAALRERRWLYGYDAERAALAASGSHEDRYMTGVA